MKGTLFLAVIALSTLVLHVVVAAEGEDEQRAEDGNGPKMSGPELERNSEWI